MKKYILLILSLLFIPACSSSNKTAVTVEPPVLLDYNITLSHSGGFTGRSQGFTIDSTGIVSSFEGKITPDIKKVYKGKMNKEQLIELNKLFPTIIKTSYAENGNMTTSILLVKENKELRFSFGGMEPDKFVPSELVKFYDSLNIIISNVKE